MSASLYSIDVLRRAASVADFPLLPDHDAKAERRSPTCGSRITVTLKLDDEGRIAAVGVDAKACALGQAAAAIFAASALGADQAAIEMVSDAWRVYLSGEQEALPDWAGLELLAAGRAYPARHPSMRLAFEAAAAAFAERETGEST